MIPYRILPPLVPLDSDELQFSGSSPVYVPPMIPYRILPLLGPLVDDEQYTTSQTTPGIPPESVHWLCLLQAQSIIQSLNLTGIANNSVVIKKIPVDRILGSTKAGNLGIQLPCVLLVPLLERQDPTKGVNSLDDVGYGVLCVTIAVDNQEPTIAAGMSTFLQWRQQINRAFRQQQPSAVPTVYQMQVEPMAIYDPQGWGTGFDVSAIIIRFISREPRGINV